MHTILNTVFNKLPNTFTLAELQRALKAAHRTVHPKDFLYPYRSMGKVVETSHNCYRKVA